MIAMVLEFTFELERSREKPKLDAYFFDRSAELRYQKLLFDSDLAMTDALALIIDRFSARTLTSPPATTLEPLILASVAKLAFESLKAAPMMDSDATAKNPVKSSV